MKRAIAILALLSGLAVLMKLGLKTPPAPGGDNGAAIVDASAEPLTPERPDPLADLLDRYGEPEHRDLIERTWDRYRQMALQIERTDGLRGLMVLDRLDIEAIHLYENYPNDFRCLRDTLSDEAAAEILLHWREYFGLKRADATDRAVLIGEIGRLAPRQRRIASRYPSVLPLLLADPIGVTDLVERWAHDESELADALAVLQFVSLDEPDASGLRAALAALDHHGPLALEAFRVLGLDGFALVLLYGPVLEALGPAFPLDQTLIVLKVNTDHVDDLLRTHRPETVASHLRHVNAAGLVAAVGSSPHGLRLVVEHGRRGERALAQAGPDAADVVYEEYADPFLRTQAVAAIAEHGPMALAMLDKYAADPDFRAILGRYGSQIIPPIAHSDPGPETLAFLRSRPKGERSFSESLAQSVLAVSGDNGQATIRTIRHEGLERVQHLHRTDLHFYEFLPLYDLIHLGNVVRRGYSPTSGEMGLALLDGCFVVLDVLSLATIQPQGVVAAEVARSEVKVAVRGASRTAGRALADQTAEVSGRVAARRAAAEGADVAGQRLARWWSVRAAGGTYQVLRRMPEALGRLSVSEIADLGRPLCAKAGLRLSTWRPLRFFKDGQEFVVRLAPERGLKIVGIHATVAGVGPLAMRKMEEHLASRRPAPESP